MESYPYQEHSLITNSSLIILLSSSGSDTKDTYILGSIRYVSLLQLAIFCMCNLQENVLFSTLIRQLRRLLLRRPIF